MRAHHRTAVSISAFLVAALLGSGARPSGASGRCAGPAEASGHTSAVAGALTARRDILGERLIASRMGPTYDAASRLLPPLWYARGRAGAAITRSGAYYLTFAYPLSLYGEKAFALHVADGSAVLTRRSDGPSLTLFVGNGDERYGSCLSRLTPPTLARGYLPIVRTAYVDGRGVRYEQESFAGRIPGVGSLVSFVRLKVDARSTTSGAGIIRLVPSAGSRQRLVTDRRGRFAANGLSYRVRGRAVIHAAWVHRPTRGVAMNARVYDTAWRNVERHWRSELAGGLTFEVPERRVMDAQRHLLGEQRILTWRYSIGNNYEELSFAEALDAAQVMAAYGHGDVSEAILRFALRRLPERYTNWRAGAVLAAAAHHDRLTGGSFVEAWTPPLVTVLERLERQVYRPGGTGLLDREAFSSDVGRQVVALHGQAVVWTGLGSMGRAWAKLGRPRLAARATAAARRLEQALRSAVRASHRRLPDGSLFVPAALLDGAPPFDRVTATREGSYWNLVMPYALAAGLFDPKGREAQGIWEYMQQHGSRLLGLVRADADRLYRGAPYPASGVDQVYGLNMARFLADADLPDQLVLSLYGTLAGAMTRKTFVAGEAATVAPLAGLRLGAMYLPPNGGTNTAFLETLRVMLVHERRNRQGAPTGLELAFATPRAWLGNGNAIRVRDAPTSFGPVSFAIERRGRTVEISVDAPRAPDLRLRLRLPSGLEIGSIETGGSAMPVDPSSRTIDLSGRVGAVRLVVRIRG